jgi:hypothetical protein
MNLLQLHGLIKKHGFIAGGACRSTIQDEEIKDFDIFCFSKEDYEPLKQIISNMYGIKRENELVYQCNNIQLIKPRENKYLKTYGTPYEVVSKFDFSVCRVYTLDGINFIKIDEQFENDCQKKILRIQNIVCPISTLKRSIKYSKKGYFSPLREILKLFNEYAERVRNGDIDIDSF